MVELGQKATYIHDIVTVESCLLSSHAVLAMVKCRLKILLPCWPVTGQV